MRLLNAESYKLEDFTGKVVPDYAILSHTWAQDREEWTLQYIQTWEARGRRAGVLPVKIRGCCRQARKDGLSWVWLDTCCIDKKNSTELSESINSMFKWYQTARRCYAYLSDVPTGDVPHKPTSQFRLSRWFRRGWTLQELLAPKRVDFYDCDWNHLGTKGEMSPIIEKITGIPRHFLKGAVPLHRASVAQRMSWAAGRVTTRREDIAYCLLGLFGVHISMIYGEGDQAFLRLQREIMTELRDDSILAWGLENLGPSEDDPDKLGDPVMATSPADFAGSGHIVCREQHMAPLHSLNFFGGSLRLQACMVTQSGGNMFTLLTCGPAGDADKVVAIPLVAARFDGSPERSGEYIRPRGRSAAILPKSVSKEATIKDIFIWKDTKSRETAVRPHPTHIYVDESDDAEIYLTDVSPVDLWDKDSGTIKLPDRPVGHYTQRIATRFRCRRQEEEDLIIMLEFENNTPPNQPICHLMTTERWFSSLEISHSFSMLRRVALGAQIAEIGDRCLTATIKQSTREQNMLDLTINKCPSMSETPINIVNELQRMTVEQELVGISRKHATFLKLDAKFEAKISVQKEQQQLVEAEISLVSQEIDELEERLAVLRTEEEALTLSSEYGHNQINNGIKKKHHVAQILADIEEERKKTEEELSEMVSHSGEQDQVSKDYIQEFYASFLRLSSKRSPGTKATGFEPSQGVLQQEAIIFGEGEMFKLLAWGDPEEPFGRLVPMALHLAAQFGRLSITQLLLQNPEAKVDEKDKTGRTPLSWAASAGSEAVCRMLLSTESVNPNTVDDLGRSPLWYAVEQGHASVVSLMLKSGADANAGDLSGDTPLLLASLGGNEVIVQSLLVAGASCTEQDKQGRTPLSLAAHRGFAGVVSLLLGACDGKWPPDNKGRSPLSYACDGQNAAVVQMLIKAGLGGDEVDSSGRNALFYAARKHRFDVPRYLCAPNECAEMVSLLREQGTPIKPEWDHLLIVEAICNPQSELFAVPDSYSGSLVPASSSEIYEPRLARPSTPPCLDPEEASDDDRDLPQDDSQCSTVLRRSYSTSDMDLYQVRAAWRPEIGSSDDEDNSSTPVRSTSTGDEDPTVSSWPKRNIIARNFINVSRAATRFIFFASFPSKGGELVYDDYDA